MSEPDEAEDLDPDELRRVIMFLHHELPEMLGENYHSFKEKLDSLLTEVSTKELLDLFAVYPAVYARLQNLLNFFSAGHGLYGDPISGRPDIVYYCSAGPHYVNASAVQKKDVMGRPLCPTHRKAMSLA
jgi:hypothetical protein